MTPTIRPRNSSSSQTARAVLLLREMLLTGQFSVGERLTELGLVGRLGTSRTPIRQALARLAAEGLLEAIPSGGFRLRAFALHDVWDAIELRGVLEGTAARMAAERLEHPDNLVMLRRHYDAMCELLPLDTDRFAPYLALNELFHRELRALAKSRILVAAIEDVMRLPFAAHSALVLSEAGSAASTQTAAVAQEHHRAIIEAIGSGAGARAEHLAREHAQIARRTLERALHNTDAFRRLPGASMIVLSRAV